jgi:hypothetical protein
MFPPVLWLHSQNDLSDATSSLLNTSAPTPDAILQTAFGFWNSKVLLTAVEFGLFTTLGQRRLTGAEIGKELALHPRGIADFLDALVAMKFLEREGDGAGAKYFNTPATALYLDRKSPRYIGGIPQMLNARLFTFWHDLPEALRTGRPQNETKHGEKGIFEELYAEPAKLEQFLDGMTGLSRINFEALADNVFGLLMSLNMLIEFGEAFDYSAADFEKWCREVGFKRFEVIRLAGPSSAAIAYK